MAFNLDAEERRLRISLRRGEHFFGNGARGIYERFERRGDRLIEFADIADWVIALDPQLSREAITNRFVLSAAHGGLGWRQYGERRAGLLDLSHFDSFAPGQYPLRPSPLTVRSLPLQMRAPRSVWVRWLRGQELPVPRELTSDELTIDAKANDVSTAQPALPKPNGADADARVQTPFDWLVAEFQRTQKRLKISDRDLMKKCQDEFPITEIEYKNIFHTLPSRYRDRSGRKPEK